jgi:hypothetical protein
MGSNIDVANTSIVTKGSTYRNKMVLHCLLGTSVTEHLNNASLLQTTYTGSNGGNINVKNTTQFFIMI